MSHVTDAELTQYAEVRNTYKALAAVVEAHSTDEQIANLTLNCGRAVQQQKYEMYAIEEGERDEWTYEVAWQNAAALAHLFGPENDDAGVEALRDYLVAWTPLVLADPRA